MFAMDLPYATVNRGVALLAERERLTRLLAANSDARDGQDIVHSGACDIDRVRLRLSEVEQMLGELGLKVAFR